MRKIFLFYAMMIPAMLKAQMLTPQVIASGGEYATGGGYSLSQTIGELNVETVTAPAAILTQGFQQPVPEIISFIGESENTNAMLDVFPNPACNVLFVRIRSEGPHNIVITDVPGKKIISSVIPASAFGPKTFDVSMLPAGVYFLTISSSDNSFNKTTRFTKS